MLGGPGQRQRPAADDDEHDRRAGRDHRLEQLLLAAEEARARRRSRNSPVVESSVRPDRSPSTTIATSASRASVDGRRELLVGAVEMPGPARVDDLGAGNRRADGVEDRPSAGQLVARLEDLAVADDAERIDAGAHLA